MTQRTKQGTPLESLGDHEKRIRVLERVTPAAGESLGLPTQVIPLPVLVVSNGADTSGFSWTRDNAYTGGGYLGSTASNAFFRFMVQMSQGGIHALRMRAGSGPDFGRFKVKIASLDAPPLGRSGDDTGKIEGSDSGTISLITVTSAIETYSAIAGGEDDPINGQLVFVVGGDPGDELTDLTVTTDPGTGFSVMDGGPGWYVIEISVDGQNGASTGFKLRFTAMAFVRLNDDGYI